MSQCKIGEEKITGSEDTAQKILRMVRNYDNEVTLKTRSRSSKSYQLFILQPGGNTDLAILAGDRDITV